MLHVADAVERGELLGEEAPGLGEQFGDGVGVGVLEPVEASEAGEVGDLLEHEAHVVERCRVVAHGRDVTDG